MRYCLPVIFLKVVLHSVLDVRPVNSDVVIPVKPGLFVPKPCSVHEFVHYNTHVEAPTP